MNARFNSLLVLVIAWAVAVTGWISEHRKRVAAEAQYEYEFNGVIEVGKIPPRITRLRSDSLWAVETTVSKPDSGWLFTWRDSNWTRAAIPRQVLLGVSTNEFHEWK